MSVLSAPVRAFLDLPASERILGPYKCHTLLGKGGFAPVFGATEEHAGQKLREVAVKVFGVGAVEGNAGLDTQGFRARVLDEASALCKVQHPNVVQFLALHEDARRGLLALVMEYAAGVSLDQQLADLEVGDPCRVALAVDVGVAVAAALAVSHQAGIVHRDVKPANVFFSNGVYKLIDFGIAAFEQPKRSRAEIRTIVLDGIPIDAVGTKASYVAALAGVPSSSEPISGTFGYIDPACLKTTASATAASDLYSLGATLFECLAGVVPAVSVARARGQAGLDQGVLRGEERPLSIGELVGDLPPPLVALIDRLLEPSREDRPRSAAVVAKAFERIRRSLPNYERRRIMRAFLSRAPEKRRIGPYILDRPLGAGAYAPVWLAVDASGDGVPREVALKLFAVASRPGHSDDEARQRVFAEARILGRLKHENIVQLHGLHASEDGTVIALAMEHVVGRSLDAIIQGRDSERADEDTKETLLPRTVAAIGFAIAKALEAVHQLGVVHGDVKPANILVAGRGAYKLVDFGGAALFAGEAARFDGRSPFADDEFGELGARDTRPDFAPKLPSRDTRSRAQRGTLGFEDPECVAQGGAPTASSDLYALGATLFCCLTGQLPAAASDGGVRLGVLDGRERAPQVATLAPSTPHALASIVDELLAPDRAERPASGAWVAGKLDLVIRELARARTRALPIEDVGPFRGLGRYGVIDRDCFFGRQGELATALGLLRSAPLLMVAGPAGSGRTSFCHAGVLAAIESCDLEAQTSQWRAVVVPSHEDPWLALTMALRPVFPEVLRFDPDTLHAGLVRHAQQSGIGLLVFFDDVERWFATGVDTVEDRQESRKTIAPLAHDAPVIATSLTVAARSGGRRLSAPPAAHARNSPSWHPQPRAPSSARMAVASNVQARPLVTNAQTGPAAARRFLADAAARVSPGMRVLCAVSSDHLEELLLSPVLPRGADVRWMSLSPLQSSGWSEVLSGGVQVFGYGWEDDDFQREVAEEIQRSAAPMALVQHALACLWDHRARVRRVDVATEEHGYLSRAVWREIGGVSGAIDRYADGVLARLEKDYSPIARRLALEVLVALTEPGGDSAPKTEAQLQESVGRSSLLDTVLVRLRTLGLVRAERGAIALAYAALAQHWRLLCATISERRATRLLFASLERHAAGWEQSPTSVPPWTRGVQDVVARRDEGLVRLSDRALKFLTFSERRHWRRHYAIRALAAFVVIALGGGVMLAVQSTSAARAEVERAKRGESRAFERLEHSLRSCDSAARGP